MSIAGRLRQLDARAARRWGWFDAKGPAVSLRLIITYQFVALVEIFIGLGTGNWLVTALAGGPLVMGIGAAWQLLLRSAGSAS